MNVLVMNSGSSSVKCQLIEFPKEKVLLKGVVEGIGSSHSLIEVAGATIKKKIANHQEAVSQLLEYVTKYNIDVIAHRVVHGGEKYATPIKITAPVISRIKKLSKLAPLHNPPNLLGIEACKKVFPKLPQVAVFDTAFHQTIPDYAYRYALPSNLYKKHGVRKYGFHGSSHEFIAAATRKLLKKSKVNVISCHLGNGSSVAAIKNNKCIDTSMGLTPLPGLIMGTRCGDLDPGIITFLAENEKLSFKEIDTLLNKKSGFLGVSGVSDMRELHSRSTSGDSSAKLTIDMLCYQLAKYIGSYYAVVGSLDAIAFTGGIGERAFYVRAKVCSYLKHFGVELDASSNKKNAEKISSKKSKVNVLVISANEELMIARHARNVMKK